MVFFVIQMLQSYLFYYPTNVPQMYFVYKRYLSSRSLFKENVGLAVVIQGILIIIYNDFYELLFNMYKNGIGKTIMINNYSIIMSEQ